MSRSAKVRFTEEQLKFLSVLGTEIRHEKMLQQKILQKNSGLFVEFQTPFNFGKVPSTRPMEDLLGQIENQPLHELTGAQKAVLQNLIRTGKALGFKQNVKTIPYLGTPVSVEFIKTEEREKVPVRPFRGGVYET